MAKDKTYPPAIRTFNFHDCFMQPPSVNGGNWTGDCPFCGKEKHFFVESEEGMWDCKVCGERGNVISFLTRIIKKFDGFATDKEWNTLSAHRQIPVKYLKRRGLVWTGERWLIPCHSEKGTVRDIRCYDYKQVISTAGCESQLFGIDVLAKAPAGSVVWHCEGEWDAMALDWLLASNAIINNIVVAVPGASVFKKEWDTFYQGKKVISLYDNDKAGDEGSEKFHARIKPLARSIHFVAWPLTLKTGYDTRDFIKENLKLGTGLKALADLRALMQDRPRTVSGGLQLSTAVSSPGKEASKGPVSFQQLIAVFRKHLHVDQDMIDALKVMLGVALSNDMPGDPLWLYLVGASSSGKTQLLSAFAGSPRCLFVSNVSSHSLISGFRGENGSDPSIIARAKDLTVIFKDFTEVLQKPEVLRNDLFGILRGAYDGSVSRPFGNGVVREYKDLYFTVLAGVTHTIHGFNNTSMGERFLKFQFKASSKARTDALLSSAIGNVGKEKTIETALQDVISAFLEKKLDIKMLPVFPDKYYARLKALVQLIAHLRSSVERDPRSGDVTFRPALEMGARLAKQLVKLAMMISIVEGHRDITDSIYSLIERIAIDTAYGFHYDIVDAVMNIGSGTATRDAIAKYIHMPASTLFRRFDDLNVLALVKGKKADDPNLMGRAPMLYTIAPHIVELWYAARGPIKSKGLLLARKTA